MHILSIALFVSLTACAVFGRVTRPKPPPPPPPPSSSESASAEASASAEGSAESAPSAPSAPSHSAPSGAGVTCRNEQGSAVDWFIVYKLPRQDAGSAGGKQSGYGRFYMDPSTNGKWVESKVGIDSDQQSIGFTLSQYYASNDQSDLFSLFYNDEIPGGTTSVTKGHTKGVSVFDKSSGFWMIHSVPKFPPADHYEYPATGAEYGQTFLCISLPASQLSEVGSQLFTNDPNIYAANVPASMAHVSSVLGDLANHKSPKAAPYTRIAKLTSLAGVQFTSFAKFKPFGQDLYAGLVAPTLQRSLTVETWQNGGHNIGSNCTIDYPVKNVANVLLDNSVKFKINNDHSKWAVADQGDWICIGDINRQETQFKRGGGTVCVQNKAVASTFLNSVASEDQCNV